MEMRYSAKLLGKDGLGTEPRQDAAEGAAGFVEDMDGWTFTVGLKYYL